MAAQERKAEIQGVAPSAEELMYILEQQDAMLQSLVDEVAQCKHVIAELSEQREEKVREQETTPPAILQTMKNDIVSAMRTIDTLQDRNSKLEAELEKVKSEAEKSSSLRILDELRLKLKDAAFERERTQREYDAARADKERAEQRVEELVRETTSAHEARQTREAEASATMCEMQKTVTECRFAAEEAKNALERQTSEQRAELEMTKHRLDHTEEHVKKMNAEILALRRERSTLMTRISTLTTESDILRSKILTNDVGVSTGIPVDSQTKKLLRDQANLIKMLRDECALLTEKMEDDQRKYRSTVREMKKTNRELEHRIDKLLKI